MANEMKEYGRGWVACREGTKKELDFEEPEAGVKAEIILARFSNRIACHFEIYFRAEDKLHSVDPESVPEDFDKEKIR